MGRSLPTWFMIRLALGTGSGAIAQADAPLLAVDVAQVAIIPDSPLHRLGYVVPPVATEETVLRLYGRARALGDAHR